MPVWGGKAGVREDNRLFGDACVGRSHIPPGRRHRVCGGRSFPGGRTYGPAPPLASVPSPPRLGSVKDRLDVSPKLTPR